jgi:hypothetical protein
MTDQPKALRLADALDELDGLFSFPGACGEAAAELRRLHNENQAAHAAGIQQEREMMVLEAEVERLREALEDLVTLCNTDFVLAADPVVIAAEAALERLYRARTALARKEPDHA